MKPFSYAIALFTALTTSPVLAAPVVYTMKSFFLASLGGAGFTNVEATLIGQGETDNVFQAYPGVVAIPLTLFRVVAQGTTYTATQPTYFVANSSLGVVGFNFDLSDLNGVTGRNFGLSGYDGSTSVPETTLANFYSIGGFQSDKGGVGLRLAADYSFSAVVSTPASAVPEPATWTMMVLGIGLVGSLMRVRLRSTSFAPRSVEHQVA